jgi:hypothetical protein
MQVMGDIHYFVFVHVGERFYAIVGFLFQLTAFFSVPNLMTERNRTSQKQEPHSETHNRKIHLQAMKVFRK